MERRADGRARKKNSRWLKNTHAYSGKYTPAPICACNSHWSLYPLGILSRFISTRQTLFVDSRNFHLFMGVCPWSNIDSLLLRIICPARTGIVFCPLFRLAVSLDCRNPRICDLRTSVLGSIPQKNHFFTKTSRRTESGALTTVFGLT